MTHIQIFRKLLLKSIFVDNFGQKLRLFHNLDSSRNFSIVLKQNETFQNFWLKLRLFEYLIKKIFFRIFWLKSRSVHNFDFIRIFQNHDWNQDFWKFLILWRLWVTMIKLKLMRFFVGSMNRVWEDICLHCYLTIKLVKKYYERQNPSRRRLISSRWMRRPTAANGSPVSGLLFNYVCVWENNLYLDKMVESRCRISTPRLWSKGPL